MSEPLIKRCPRCGGKRTMETAIGARWCRDCREYYHPKRDVADIGKTNARAARPHARRSLER